MFILLLCNRYSSTPVCQVCICWQSRQFLDLCGTEDQDFGVRQCQDCRGPAGQYRPCYHLHAAAVRAVCYIRAVTNVIAERDARALKTSKGWLFSPQPLDFAKHNTTNKQINTTINNGFRTDLYHDQVRRCCCSGLAFRLHDGLGQS